MSYHEGSNWQARKEDEGKPIYGKEPTKPIPKEDDLWKEIAIKFRLIYTDELESELIQKLSQHYTITKKTV